MFFIHLLAIYLFSSFSHTSLHTLTPSCMYGSLFFCNSSLYLMEVKAAHLPTLGSIWKHGECVKKGHFPSLSNYGSLLLFGSGKAKYPAEPGTIPLKELLWPQCQCMSVGKQCVTFYIHYPSNNVWSSVKIWNYDLDKYSIFEVTLGMNIYCIETQEYFSLSIKCASLYHG